MAQIGRIKKYSQGYPSYLSKKRGTNVENVTATTPNSKRRRYQSTAAATTTAITPVVLDKTNNISDVNQMKKLLSDMSEELGGDVTSSFILSNVAQILKLAFVDAEEAISTLVNDHLGLVYAPATAGAVTPVGNTSQQSTKSAMAPASIAPETVFPVRYNPNIFELTPLNPNLPSLWGSHGRVNLHRFKAKLVEMLKDCGTVEHQLFLLHKVLTEGELA